MSVLLHNAYSMYRVNDFLKGGAVLVLHHARFDESVVPQCLVFFLFFFFWGGGWLATLSLVSSLVNFLAHHVHCI